jgi:hypothetical protein
MRRLELLIPPNTYITIVIVVISIWSERYALEQAVGKLTASN